MLDDYEFLLEDRIAKIKAINEQYDLESKAYLSFSGGKDSTILHYLLDMALPNNKIPRVFLNTGIEYNFIVDFVKDLANKDKRLIILKPTEAIKPMLEKYGYPFKSKLHAKRVYEFQKRGCELNRTLEKYVNQENITFNCPKILKYQFDTNFKLNISHLCCQKLKKDPAKKWQKENNKSIVLTGMRREEGGTRGHIQGCVLTDKKGNVTKFHPLLVVTDEWEEWFINEYKIELCKLYYPPFNFTRTGCKGCPFTLKIQDLLNTMQQLLPNEYKQCELIWKPVYDEYRRLNYRLKKEAIKNVG